MALRLNRRLSWRFDGLDAACLRHSIPSLIETLLGGDKLALCVGKLALGSVPSRNRLAKLLTKSGKLALAIT